MDLERLLDRADELIGIESTEDRPRQREQALAYMLSIIGTGFEIVPFTSHGRDSALIHRRGPREEIRVVLNAHLDVVPGEPGQFVARREGDRLYGRGAHDMKVAALVMAEVFVELADELPYRLALQLVTDEEVGGRNGTRHQLNHGVTAGFAVIGEQSGLRIVTDSRGLCHVRLHARGTTAHAAYPWLGENALLTLTAAVDAILRRYPVPAAETWSTTVNVARIETGNRAVNQVPAEATAWLDIRFPPEDAGFHGRTPEDVAAYLRTLAGDRVGVTVDALDAPHHADPACREVGLLAAAARSVGFSGERLRKHGAADGRHYSERGINAVIFGPGGDGQHGPAEYADITTIQPYHDALVTFLRSLA